MTTDDLAEAFLDSLTPESVALTATHYPLQLVTFVRDVCKRLHAVEAERDAWKAAADALAAERDEARASVAMLMATCTTLRQAVEEAARQINEAVGEFK